MIYAVVMYVHFTVVLFMLYWGFVPIDTKNVRTKFEVRSFIHS